MTNAIDIVEWWELRRGDTVALRSGGPPFLKIDKIDYRLAQIQFDNGDWVSCCPGDPGEGGWARVTLPEGR